MERCYTLGDPRPHPTSDRPGRFAEMICLLCGHIYYYAWDDLVQPRPWIMTCVSCQSLTAMPVWGRRPN